MSSPQPVRHGYRRIEQQLDIPSLLNRSTNLSAFSPQKPASPTKDNSSAPHFNPHMWQYRVQHSP
jgi:hypothetical protein